MDFNKIGWVGLGAMGSRMVQNLIDAGYDVTVYNRTKSKEEPFKEAGVKTASLLSHLIETTDIVFVMVSDDDAVRDVFTMKHGLMDAMATGKILINMSTVSPEVSMEMAELCTAGMKKYIDAPVSGSLIQAADGSLVIMAGGKKALVDAVKPVLEQLGKAVFHVGEVGAGNKAKLAVNLFLAITTQGFAEMVLFAEKLGIKREDILGIINSGGLSSPYTRVKSKATLDSHFPPAFVLKHMAKDLRLAHDKDLNTSLGTAAYQTFQQASKEYGEEDVMAVIRYIARKV